MDTSSWRQGHYFAFASSQSHHGGGGRDVEGMRYGAWLIGEPGGVQAGFGLPRLSDAHHRSGPP